MATFNGKEILGILTKAVPTKLESKTVTPSDSQQIVLPSEGYTGLKSVIVEPAKGAVEGVFSGSRSEYEAAYANGEIPVGTIVIIKDELA